MKIRAPLFVATLAALVSAAAALGSTPPTPDGAPPTQKANHVGLGDTVWQPTTYTGTHYDGCPGYPVYNEVQFVWKASASQAVEVDTFRSTFDTVLCVIERSNGKNNVLGANNDYGGTLQSRVDFTATKGHVYNFVAGGHTSSTYGTLYLHLGAAT